MPDEVRPPDMVGAGITPPAQDTNSMLQALQQAASRPLYTQPGQAGATALAGAVAGWHGQQNPMLAQLQQQRQQDFQNQLQMTHIRNTLAQQEMKKTEALLGVAAGLVKQGGPAAKMGAPIFADSLGKMGYKVPEGFADALASERLTFADIENIRRAKVEGIPIQDLSKAYPNVSPQTVQSIYFQPVPQQAMKRYGFKTDEELAREAAETKTAKANAWIASNPGFKDTEHLKGVLGYGQQFVRKNFQTNLEGLSPDNPADAQVIEMALDYAKDQAHKQWSVDKAYEQKLIEDRQTSITKLRAQLKSSEPKPLTPSAWATSTKGLKAAETGVSEMKVILGAAQSLSKDGYLPQTPGVFQTNVAALKRWWSLQGDQRKAAVDGFLNPVTIGIIDRGLNDEKGTRSVQIFHQQLETWQKYPTFETFKTMMETYDYLLYRAARRDVLNLNRQRGRIPDTDIQTAMDAMKEIWPEGPPPEPKWMMLIPAGAK